MGGWRKPYGISLHECGWLGMDQRDAGQSATACQKIRGKTGSVVDIQAFADSMGEKGLFKNHGKRTDGLGCLECMTDHHSGVVIDDGAQDGLDRSPSGFNSGTVHEIADPQLVDIILLESLADIASRIG